MSTAGQHQSTLAPTVIRVLVSRAAAGQPGAHTNGRMHRKSRSFRPLG